MALSKAAKRECRSFPALTRPTLRKIPTVKKGKAAEFIFVSECLLYGFDCYGPMTEDGKTDLIVGPHSYKTQTKVVTAGKMSVRKVHVNAKSTTKVSHYSAEDIDFFVGVDLTTKDIYVVPVEISAKYTSCVSATVLEALGFKNNVGILGVGRGGEI